MPISCLRSNAERSPDAQYPVYFCQLFEYAPGFSILELLQDGSASVTHQDLGLAILCQLQADSPLQKKPQYPCTAKWYVQGRGIRVFAGRQGLTSEQRLVDLLAAAGEQTQVRRHPQAGPQTDDVAGKRPFRVDLAGNAVPQDSGWVVTRLRGAVALFSAE